MLWTMLSNGQLCTHARRLEALKRHNQGCGRLGLSCVSVFGADLLGCALPMAPRKKLAHRILGACVQHARLLSVILYVAAIASFLALPVFVKRNYLDENALLAGFAHSQIRYSTMLPEVSDAFTSVSELEQNPQALARQMLASMHLKHWQIPAHSAACNASVVHSVLRASRGDGKEALVLVTPVNGSSLDTAAAKAGVHVGLAVLRYLQHVPWLAKDVIWVIPDVSCGTLSTMQNWLDIYHGSNRGSRAFGQAGLIQQALVLQMDADRFNSLKVETVGWNGRMPMLDLFYLVRRVAEIGPGLALAHVEAAPFLQHFPPHFHAYWLDLWRALCFSWQQATGIPTGIHAEFAQYGIDAITIEATLEPSKAAWSYSTEEGNMKLAMLLELTLRSLNNLLERFHHSTTFYMLLSSDWHIPFQIHILPPLLLTLILVLQAADANPPKQRCKTEASRHVIGGTFGPWTEAVKHMLSIHLLCSFCKGSLLACSHYIPILITMSKDFVPRLHAMTFLAFVSFLATITVCSLAHKVGHAFQPLRRDSKLLHTQRMQKTGLGIAAAQSAALLCVDWAAAFFILLPLVPLLSKWQTAPRKSFSLQRVVSCGTSLLLSFCILLACIYTYAFAHTGSGLQPLRSSASESLFSLTSSHKTYILNALLTSVLPCCLAVFTSS